MVKSLTSLLVAALLLAAAGLFEWFYIDKEFSRFNEELTCLYEKAEEHTANGEDAKAVQTAWEQRKDKLHVWIPHNDIARVDDYLNEAIQYISNEEYDLALAKLKVLIHLSETLPDTYRPGIENVF